MQPLNFAPQADPNAVPSNYVLHIASTHCTGCGSVAKFSTFSAEYKLRGRMGMGTTRHMVTCDSPRYNLPVVVERVKEKTIPLCGECATLSLAHLPPPPAPSGAVVNNTFRDVEMKSGPRKAATPAKPATPKPNILDLA